MCYYRYALLRPNLHELTRIFVNLGVMPAGIVVADMLLVSFKRIGFYLAE